MQQPDTKTVNRVVLSSLIGATIEWYDFFLYGVMGGIVLNKLYSPADDPTTSLMLTYATFALGFLPGQSVALCSVILETALDERACSFSHS